MKRTFRIALMLTVLLLCISNIVFSQQSPRTRESFNEEWKFVKYFNASDEAATIDKEPAGLESPSFNDNTWRTLDLPHDWAIEGPFSDTLENNTGLLPWKGIGWYRKHFTVSDFG